MIAETFSGCDPASIPAVLVKSHGPFAWGKDCAEAVHNAVVLEELAMMAWHTEAIAGPAPAMPQVLLDKHFYGSTAQTPTMGRKNSYVRCNDGSCSDCDGAGVSPKAEGGGA